MAGVSYLHHLHGEDEDDKGDVLVSFDSFPYWSQDFDGFHVYTSDLDFPLSDFRFSSGRQHPPRQSHSRGFSDNISGTQSITNPDLFDRGNQVNFVMDLFQQRVEQSSSLMERVFGEMTEDRFDVDLDLGLGLPGSREMESDSSEVNLDLGLGFAGGVNRNDDEINGVSGFMVADFSNDLSLSRRNGTISDSGGSSTVSGVPENFMSGLRVVDIESDSEDAGEIEESFDEENVYDDDDDESLRACWAAFQLADEAYNLGDRNEDFEWEEVDVRIDERELVVDMHYRETEDHRRESELEVVDMLYRETEDDRRERELEVVDMLYRETEDDRRDRETEDDRRERELEVVDRLYRETEDERRVRELEEVDMLYREIEDERRVRELEWEVILNVHNLEENSESRNGGESFDSDFEMFFGQFADVENTWIGRPPASKVAVENLLSVYITKDDVEKNDALCAICKDEINCGQMAKMLPCVHRYHGECIVPWLGIRNTCPVCRYELPTDDPDYERVKAERAGRTN